MATAVRPRLSHPAGFGTAFSRDFEMPSVSV